MKRSPMPPRSAPFKRSSGFAPPVVSSDLGTTKRGYKTVSAGRLTRKQLSDAAMAAARPIVLARADGRCEVTGLPLVDHPHLHHRHRRGHPRYDVPSNLIAVNPQSHLAVFDGSIHAEPAQSRWFGWIVRPGRDWRTAPVLIRGQWTLLDDDGGYTATTNPHLERGNPA